jgi:hypothetical protein
MALLAVPWTIKPAFGLLSDFVPLFGSRRRNYLLLANGLAAASLLLRSPGSLTIGAGTLDDAGEGAMSLASALVSGSVLFAGRTHHDRPRRQPARPALRRDKHIQQQ